MKKFILSTVTGSLLLGTSLFAASNNTNSISQFEHQNKIAKMYGKDVYVVNNADKDRINKTFRLPANRVEIIGKKKSPVKGMIEYILKDKRSSATQVFYYDPKEHIFFVGYLIKENSGDNLTKKDLQKYNKISQERFAKEEISLNKKRLNIINQSIYDNNLVYHFKGKGKGSIILFTDPACPFCKKFEKIGGLNYIANNYKDITIVLFPLKRIHPEALERSVYFYQEINKNHVKNANQAAIIFEKASFLPFSKIKEENKKDKNYKQNYKKLDTLSDKMMSEKVFYSFGVPNIMNAEGKNMRKEVTKGAILDMIKRMKNNQRSKIQVK